MPGPARAGLFLHAIDPNRVASFYEAVANMKRLSTSDSLLVLESPDIQLLIHRIPEQFAKDIVITTPPQRREDSALKFFFTVASLEHARDAAAKLGGEVFNENWQGPGFVVCNAMDPEGNVFQLRQRAA